MIEWGKKGRFLREEGGFTLTEMMITIVIWIVMLFALYGLFDMSIRVFSFGNNKVEAMESARLGLERMEREIRAAFAVSPTSNHLFFSANGSTSNPPQAMPTATQITFGNDLGAAGASNEIIECGDPCEYITYKLTGDELRRVNTANSGDPGDPVVENVNALNFTYFESDDTTAESEGEIVRVLVSLDIAVSPGTDYEATQRLTTEIDLRNRL
jgi:type II secretory pathway component PulJ